MIKTLLFIDLLSGIFLKICMYYFSVNTNFLPWLVWLSGLSAILQTKRSPVRFPQSGYMPVLQSWSGPQ